MKHIKLFEEYINKSYPIGDYKDFDSLTEKDLYEIAKWGLTGDFYFSGAWDDADNNLEVASQTVVDSFKILLDEPYPEGFKNTPKVLTLYRMLSLKNIEDLNTKNLGFSWFSNIDRKNNRYFLDQLEHLRSGKVFMVTANIPISNVDIARSLWQRDCIYVENEVVIKDDTNIDVIEVEQIYKHRNAIVESKNLSEDWTHDIVEGLTAYYKPSRDVKKLTYLIREVVDMALKSQSFESFNDFIGQHNPKYWETNKHGKYKNLWWITLAYLLGETETMVYDTIDEDFSRMVISIMDKSVDDRQE